MGNGPINQHKQMAMGQSLAKGGLVVKPAGSGRPLKTGMPDSPITDAKRANGIPGMKKGGKVK